MTRFDVTYEIVTQESAEQGDAEERGFISQNISLRDAIADVCATRTCHVAGVIAIEASSFPSNDFRWVTVDNDMEYLTGAYESRSLHIPEHVTPSSRGRILRLVRGY